MGRSHFEKKFSARRFKFRSGLRELLIKYEEIRDYEVFTAREQARLDTVYYKVEEYLEKDRNKK